MKVQTNMFLYQGGCKYQKMIDLNKIKMIIWDLDDTFWEGTLGEKNICLSESRSMLIVHLSQRGIVNSICSKNEYEDVMQILTERGLKDYFVFPSINWAAKGQRVLDIIKKCRLRAENVLFIDDNSFNLEEVQFYNPGINVALPNIILEIESKLYELGKDDSALTRLNQYHLLEKKEQEFKTFDSNEEFLYHSNIKVEIFHNVIDEFDRLYELMQRTNHLNFTKLRQNQDEFRSTLELCDAESGYIRVTDKYGDYGIVGFWVISHGKVLHFVFSCRVLGMGIEQFVYSYLKYPNVTVKGNVSTQLEMNVSVPWVNVDKIATQGDNAKKNQSSVVLLKGRCDLNNVVQYLSSHKLINEGNYIDDLGHDTSLASCTTNIVLSQQLALEKKKLISSSVPMFDCALESTKMFDSSCDAVILSLASEYSFGVYRSKAERDIILSVGDCFFDMTDREKWQAYIDKEIYTLGYSLSKEDFVTFSESYEKTDLQPEDIVKNITCIRSHLPPKTKLILLLGNDQYMTRNGGLFESEKLKKYGRLNRSILNVFYGREDILIVNANDFLNESSDITDSIMHYTRRIYYNIAQKINSLI